ncbi:P-loop NTPase fold protein [Sorangium sp. So ce381]|uniref:P-loop NTPase fold protein n=1 Tax=Sorangium sp. So ce381 TaxID=3133307 RepID=UPI003F5AFFAC
MSTGTSMSEKSVSLHDDTVDPPRGRTWMEVVTPALADLFAYGHGWTLAQQRTKDNCTLTFSSMLAAMVAGRDDVCVWLRGHLARRGVGTAAIVGARSNVKGGVSTSPTLTTTSFRDALHEAKAIRDATGSGTLDVRHFLAAYAIRKNYHLADFLRLRIDRRALCLELAEEMSTRFPAEAAAWKEFAARAPAVSVPGFDADGPRGPDLLNIEREVEAFAMLIAGRMTITPLSIGIFGAWGSGKSFFMRAVRERVAALAALARHVSSEERAACAYHGQIAQVEFNAWHYSERNIIASMVDHLFRNLRFDAQADAEKEQAELAARKEALLKAIRGAEASVKEREDEVERAKGEHEQVAAEIQGLDQDIKARQAELSTAEQAFDAARDTLAERLQSVADEIERRRAQAPARAALDVVIGELREDNEISRAEGALDDLVKQGREVSALGVEHLLLGVGAVALIAVVARFMTTNTYAHVIAPTIGSALALIAAARPVAEAWRERLSKVAAKGKELKRAIEGRAEAAAKQVTDAHEAELANARAAVDAHVADIARLREELGRLENAPAAKQKELAELERKRAEAVERRAKADAELSERRRELERLSTNVLLEEFVGDREATQTYRRELGIFAQVRNDFERLSRLMTKASEEYYDPEKKDAPPPTVSRIVLYIDDLDRCPEDKVIEVLRAVHLLLAFPLFVVVVAVDPRWVTQCLRQEPGLLLAASAFSEQELQMLGGATTAAYYLEKIFQIPLWLRPIPTTQRPALVRALLGPRAPAPPRLPETPRIQEKALEQPRAGSPQTESAAEDAGAGHTKRSERSATLTSKVEITQVELDHVEALGSLLDGNPRALKRFANTYRLVKTALSDVELDVFTTTNPAPYRVCMALLAMLATQRRRALALVASAEAQPPQTKVGAWLATLADSSHEQDRDVARCLGAALGDDAHVLDLATFTLWLERTRRYSFYL